jgi:hypothetical protein
LFAVLALKTFLKTDYRGVVAFLADFAELHDDLGLTNLPHCSTLKYAHDRLLKGDFLGLLEGAVTSALHCGLIPEKPTVAVDATGLDARHAPRYFVARSGGEQTARSWPKLTAAIDLHFHFVAGITVTTGPTNDSPQFAPVLPLASLLILWDRVLADAAFDSEGHHRFTREDLGSARR